jgi:hypothetical protein
MINEAKLRSDIADAIQRWANIHAEHMLTKLGNDDDDAVACQLRAELSSKILAIVREATASKRGQRRTP